MIGFCFALFIAEKWPFLDVMRITINLLAQSSMGTSMKNEKNMDLQLM